MLYRSRAVADEVAAAHRRLDAHRVSPETGRCRACRAAVPCDDANDAAGFLAERGLLAPQPSTVDAPRLLTYAWERLFGRLSGP